MNRAKIFRLVSSGRFAAPVAVAVFGFLLAASSAKAGCGAPAGPFPSLKPQENAWSNFSDDDYSQKPGSIVGLWYVVYTATYATPGPPFDVPSPAPSGGFQFFQSYKTWHRDGTEFENAFLPPAGGNICYGVWRQLGNGNVKLHHIGLLFAQDGSVGNTFTNEEIDRVSSDGKTYHGTFDFKIFDATDVFGTGTPVQEIKGTTAAKRITVD